MIKQLSCFVDNRPGSLMEVTSALKDADINIRAIASLDTPEFAILRLVVEEPEKAKEHLTKKGFVVRVHEVIGVELKDARGSLNNMLELLANGKIDIKYIYTFIFRNGKAPVLVFDTDEVERAVNLLTEAGERVVGDGEL